MTKHNHTPEPWIPVTTMVEYPKDGVADICSTATRDYGQESYGRSYEEEIANARRIAAAVNACSGISTEALENAVIDDLIEALEAILRAKTNSNGETPELALHLVEPARSALKKARGEV